MSRAISWRHVASVLVLTILVVLAAGSSGDGGGGSTSGTPTKIDAWVMAQEFVEDSLKSPSTAEYGSVFGDYQDPDEVVMDLGDGEFLVSAWVDSENSFGAKLRTHFVCELQYVGNDRWRLVDLKFIN